MSPLADGEGGAQGPGKGCGFFKALTFLDHSEPAGSLTARWAVGGQEGNTDLQVILFIQNAFAGR